YRDAKALEIEDRRAKVLEMRSKRLTWYAIADALGISHEQARQDYLASLREAKERRLQAADIALDDEIELLETLRAAHMPQALQGDDRAAAIDVRCNAQLHQLSAVTAPARADAGEKRLVLTWNTTLIHNAPAQPSTDAETIRITRDDAPPMLE